MEKILAQNLLTLASRYGAASGLKETTVARHCSQDSAFFSRIRDGKTFTARKYDLVLVWFSENWPAAASWPPAIRRPGVRRPVAASFASLTGHACSPFPISVPGEDATPPRARHVNESAAPLPAGSAR